MAAIPVTTFCLAIESTRPDEIVLISALMAWSRAIRHAPGHVSFAVSDAEETPGLYVVHTAWASPTDLEMHLAGMMFGDVLATCQMLRRGVHLEAGGPAARREHPEALLRRVRGHAPRLRWLLDSGLVPDRAACGRAAGAA